jgi:hypothetical protein
MNDFSELENELKKLRPAQPSAELVARIDAAFTKADSNQTTDPHLNPLPQGEADAERRVRVTHSTSTDARNIIHPARFKVSWLSLGLGLAAAAIFLIFARVGVDRPAKRTPITQNTPAPETRSTIASPRFIPAGATQVVYNTRDEGLHFPAGYDEPMRRVRYQKRETLQWRNPNTGASLRVSYPSEEVVLIPVSGQ